MNDESIEKTALPPDLTGRVLGDYQLQRRLGRGGMADVYLARQNSLNRNVALKILKPNLAKDESYVKRFRQEAQAAAGLMQANIVQIYEVGECEGFYFISQEYVQGRNLSQYLTRHGAVESVMAINVIRQSALALQEAGKANVIHRDIKPENIMLSTKGEVKITDFGLARINNNQAEQALTQIGVTMGTPLYMSPEQVEGSPLDHRSDIYSLGVTAYQMLAGHPPFDGDNALSIALQHVKDAPVPIGELRPDIPVELCQLIDKMMAKKRNNRPADAKALLKELRKVKVDMDDDWEMIVEKLATADIHSTADTRSFSQTKLAATMQLQAVMQGNVRPWWKAPATWVTAGVLSAAGFFGGMMLANKTPPATLLNISQFDSNAVPQKANAQMQYRAAQAASYTFSSDTDKQVTYLKAVEEYFPVTGPDQENYNQVVLANLRAKARLSEIYLTDGKMNEAEEIFDNLAGDLARQPTDEFRLHGFAGQAIVYHAAMTKSSDESQKEALKQKIGEAIGKVVPSLSKLNEFMRTRFKNVFDRFNEEKNAESQPTSET